jgi:hypothetical protein
VTDHALLPVAAYGAQGASDVVNRTSLWLQEVQAIAAVATTVGVLIALYVATIREPRKAAEEGRRHKAQMDALRRAHRKRVAAQARKVIPSCARTPMFGASWWTVTVDNASNAMTTILAVEVKAINTNGLEVPDGCQQVSNRTILDQAFDRLSRRRYRDRLTTVLNNRQSAKWRSLALRCSALAKDRRRSDRHCGTL